MNEFLKKLERGLKRMSLEERREILDDYREHFRLGLEAGKSEQQIAAALGSPEKLAKTFVVFAASVRAHHTRRLSDMLRLIGAGISCKAGGGLVVGTLYFVCLAILTALFASAAALVLAGAGCVFLIFLEISAGYALYAVLAFFAGLTLTSGGLLITKGCLMLWRRTLSQLPLFARRIMKLDSTKEALI